jgi:hypothetical protein
MDAHRRCLSTLVGILCVFLPPSALAQFEGSFSLSKSTYLAGEPIFLSFSLKNVSTEPFVIPTADPMSSCSGYHFDVQGARDRDALPCMGGFGGSCMSSDTVVHPGELRTEKILLNSRYDLRQPGRYTLHVTHTLHYAPGSNDDLTLLYTSSLDQDFEDTLDIVIEPSHPDDLQSDFAPYVPNLHSRDWRTRDDAAKVIAYLAPPFLEPVILNMLDDPQLQTYGVEGLRNLGTPSAHRALVEFVGHSSPTNVSGTYQTALRYLGEIGDAGDVAVLLEVAKANPPDSYSREVAIESAGKAGGADAVPALVTELSDPSIGTEQDAVRALYLTGSREAVPVLINLLRSPEWRVSSTAEFGLEALTHRSGADTHEMKPPPADTYSKWVRWWTLHGQSAAIFKSDQCDKVEPLPPL